MYFLFILLFSSCKVWEGEKWAIKSTITNPGPSVITTATLASVNIVSDVVTINGSGFTNFSLVKIVGSGVNVTLNIDSVTDTQIIAKTSSAFSMLLSGTFDLIIGTAQAQATFPITFTMPTNSVDLNKLKTAGASTGYVIKFDGSNWVASPQNETQIFQGAWNALTNSPDLTIVSSTPGDYYIATAAGTFGPDTYAIGDWIISDGYNWNRVPVAKTSVTSFQGRKGIVELLPSDYVSLVDSVTSKLPGSKIADIADVNFTVGPTNGQVLKWNTATSKWLPASDDSGAGLVYGSFSATAPLVYSGAGVFSITPATTIAAGSLSAADKTKLDTLGAMPAGDGLVERFSSTLLMKTCGAGEMLVWYSLTGWTCTTSVMLPGTSAQSLGMLRNSTANTAGNNLTIGASGATVASTDKNGGNLVLASGTSTGTGNSKIEFQTTSAGNAGTADSAPTTKMTILGNGNVGIGTTTPSYPLEVAETPSSTYGILLTSPSANANGASIGFTSNNGNNSGIFQLDNSGNMVFRNSNNTNRGMYFDFPSTGGTLNFRSGAGGTTVLYANSSGNVGVGTNSPSVGFELGSVSAGKSQIINATEGPEMAPPLESSYWSGSDGWSAGGGNLVRVVGSASSTITPSGSFNVTAGRIYKVVFNVSAASGYNYNSLGGTNGREGLNPGLHTQYLTATNTNKISFISNNGSSTITITSLSIKELTFGTGDLTVYGRIISAGGIYSSLGNLGLDINSELGTVGLAGARASTAGYGLVVNGHILSNSGFIYSNGFSYASTSFLYLNEAANTASVRNNLNQQTFRVYNTYTNASNYERLNISGVAGSSLNLTADSAGTGAANLNVVLTPKGSGYTLLNGSVGIGTASPSYLLHVNGTAGGTSAYQVTSDLRFKKNILPISRSLDKLTSLDGVTYNFRNDEFPEMNFSKRKEMGVIAQKVEKFFPEAVSKDKDGFRAVAYTMLIAPIIEAIKELKNWIFDVDQEVKNQKREIANLKTENIQMKKRLEALEAKLKTRD